jgi:hypothetical protein
MINVLFLLLCLFETWGRALKSHFQKDNNKEIVFKRNLSLW